MSFAYASTVYLAFLIRHTDAAIATSKWPHQSTHLFGRKMNMKWHSPSTSPKKTWEFRTWIFHFVQWTLLRTRKIEPIKIGLCAASKLRNLDRSCCQWTPPETWYMFDGHAVFRTSLFVHQRFESASSSTQRNFYRLV